MNLKCHGWNPWPNIMVSMNQCKDALSDCAIKVFVQSCGYAWICVGTHVNMHCVNAWLWYTFHCIDNSQNDRIIGSSNIILWDDMNAGKWIAWKR